MTNRTTVLQGGCWPTSQQEWLLRAALLEGKDSIEDWEKWKSSVAIDTLDDLDRGSYRMLPLLYRNLRDQGIEDSFTAKLKSVYRRTWYENQRLFHDMRAILEAFHSAGIETLILKGTALILLHYKDYGVRPTADFDVLVHPEQAATAVDLLEKRGWAKVGTETDFVLHGRAFRDAAGREIDVHRYVLTECCYAHADDDFWDGAVTVEIDKVTTRALNPTDQLLHACVHGTRWDPVPPIRWIADAMVILKTSQREIDWNRLIGQMQTRRLTMPLKETLGYLRDVFAAPIPDEVMSRVRNLPVSGFERFEYRYKSRNHEQRTLGGLPLHWFRYLRSAKNIDSWHKIAGFFKFLQTFWKLESLWQLPRYSAGLAMRRMQTIRARYKNRKTRM